MSLDSNFLRIDMPGRAQPEANILSIQIMISSYVETAQVTLLSFTAVLMSIFASELQEAKGGLCLKESATSTQPMFFSLRIYLEINLINQGEGVIWARLGPSVIGVIMLVAEHLFSVL